MIEANSTIYNNLDFMGKVLSPAIATNTRLFPILIVIIALILVLVRQKRWAEFAAHRKWSSRIILFFPTLVLAIFLPVVGGWSFRYIPVRLEYESPHLVVTAIKLGIYGLYVGHEEDQLLPGTHDLRNCVAMLSWAEVQAHAKSCGDDRPCIENLKPLSREDIIAKIKESQSVKIDKVSDACKSIDIAKLSPI